MGSKRKGSNVSSSTTTTSVVSSVHGAQNSWEETMHRLKEMNSNENMFSHLLINLESLPVFMADLEAKQEELVSKADRIKSDLLHEIEHAREACREESDDLYRMKEHLSELEYEKDVLREALVELDTSEHDVIERIYRYQAEAKQEVESIDQVEAERIKAVPRLKHAISLYGMVTGIKWDFDKEDVLAGELTVPKKSVIRRFSIDPKEHSEFEIANMLWGFMDGAPSCGGMGST